MCGLSCLDPIFLTCFGSMFWPKVKVTLQDLAFGVGLLTGGLRFGLGRFGS